MLSMCNHLCLKYQNFHVILFNKSYFVYSGKFTQFLGIDRRQYANDYNSTRSMYQDESIMLVNRKALFGMEFHHFFGRNICWVMAMMKMTTERKKERDALI